MQTAGPETANTLSRPARPLAPPRAGMSGTTSRYRTTTQARSQGEQRDESAR
jgi:hypothetical protein